MTSWHPHPWHPPHQELSLGTVYTTLAAFFLLNSGGVRAVVVTVTVPLLVTAIAMIFCPDTPKYLATSGENINPL